MANHFLHNCHNCLNCHIVPQHFNMFKLKLLRMLSDEKCIKVAKLTVSENYFCNSKGEELCSSKEPLGHVTLTLILHVHTLHTPELVSAQTLCNLKIKVNKGIYNQCMSSLQISKACRENERNAIEFEMVSKETQCFYLLE